MREIEIILVDDGSPDGCPQMCDQYAGEDSRVRVFHQKNAGVSAARNHGMKAASAEWIMFVDSDDWLERDAVQTLYEKAEKTGSDIVCASYYLNYPSKQIQIKPDRAAVGEYQTAQNLETLLGGVVSDQGEPLNALGSPWGKIYRRRILTENDLAFPVGLRRTQDWVFNLYAVRYAAKISIIDTPVCHYRKWAGSVRHKLFPDQLEIYRQIHAEMFAFMEKFQLQQEFQTHCNYVILCSIFEFSKLLGKNVSSISDFRAFVVSLKGFCAEADCKKAAEDTPLSFVINKKVKFFLWLLKRRMYRTMILLCFIYGKVFPHK